MKYIVFDLEWNQCPTGKEHEDPLLPFEILEIGACRLNERLETEDSFHSFVSPKVYKTLHYMTRRVIHLTKADLKNQPSFPEACARFFEWCGSDCVFCSWGPSDLYELQRNLKFYGMLDLLPGPVFFEDAQKLFAISFEDRLKRRSLAYAAEFLKIAQTREYHRAYDDAAYTALVLQQLPEDVLHYDYSIDCYQYPKKKSEEIRLFYDGYEKYISRAFASKETAMKDREVTALRCVVCGKNVKRLLRWTSRSGRHYIAVGACPDHGYMFGRIRAKHTESGEIYVEKLTRTASTEEAEAELGQHG